MKINDQLKPKFRCIIHGSFQKHYGLIKQVHKIFIEAGIEVLAPSMGEIKSIDDGFVFLETDQETDRRMVELIYLHNLKRLGENGFSYFVNPEGYIGRATSYELGIAQISNTRCFFTEQPIDHPAYIHKNSIWQARRLANYILENNSLPAPIIKRDEKTIHQLWLDMMVPGSVVAVGGIIEFDNCKSSTEKEVLLVKTHKWGGKYSVIGGKLKRNERLDEAFVREIKEETGLRATIGQHICTFDQIKNSGYYLTGTQHIFIDKVAKVNKKRVQLNSEAEDYIWITPKTALMELPLEPNAKYTLELYSKMTVA
ncbi:MAG: NUDIX domain-containing protein [Candidatus Pacebacteria bacterium]|nr:NUDIX domain-containing protein [Candidatus Paceibacterota bacterium]